MSEEHLCEGGIFADKEVLRSTYVPEKLQYFLLREINK